MTSMQEKLKKIRDALVGVLGDRAYHYWNPSDDTQYIVWAEDGEDGALSGDNHKIGQTGHGTVDLFTVMEFDPTFDAVQDALNGVGGVAWRWSSTQYEDGTKLIHHEWEFWII